MSAESGMLIKCCGHQNAPFSADEDGYLSRSELMSCMGKLRIHRGHCFLCNLKDTFDILYALL